MHNRHGRALSVPLQLSLCAYQTKTETHTSLIDAWNFWHSDSKWICIASKIFNEWIFSSTPKMVWFARSTTHASGQNITEVNKKKTKNISIDRARSARFVHARQVIAARQWSKYRKPAYPLRSSRKGHAGLHVSANRNAFCIRNSMLRWKFNFNSMPNADALRWNGAKKEISLCVCVWGEIPSVIMVIIRGLILYSFDFGH